MFHSRLGLVLLCCPETSLELVASSDAPTVASHKHEPSQSASVHDVRSVWVFKLSLLLFKIRNML